MLVVIWTSLTALRRSLQQAFDRFTLTLYMQQGASVASMSTKKAMGVKMEGRLGKKLHSNDLRLRLGGGAGQQASKATAQKVTFQPDIETVEQQADGDRWSNDMYFKSGQATMGAPLRQAVTERPPSFLTTKSGSRRGAPAAASAGAARVLASAGILVLCVCWCFWAAGSWWRRQLSSRVDTQKMSTCLCDSESQGEPLQSKTGGGGSADKGPRVSADLSGIVRRGRGTFSYKG